MRMHLSILSDDSLQTFNICAVQLGKLAVFEDICNYAVAVFKLVENVCRC